MKRTIVIGGGAAGMMAAIQNALCGNEVTLLEKNEKLGKKLFITGKGRCNLTNACDISDLFTNVVTNPKFLYSAFYSFSNEDVMRFFESLSLPLKTERGNRVFPRSDKSSDVIRALERECRRLHVKICLNRTVKELCIKHNVTQHGAAKQSRGQHSTVQHSTVQHSTGQHSTVCGVCMSDGTIYPAEKVIVATGGSTYRSTGSTGDGYRLAKQCGHTVTAIRPGLTGMTASVDIGKQLQGLTLRNVRIWMTVRGKKKQCYDGFGELLFTHYGVSGPLILTASSLVGDILQEQELLLHIDCKPALTREQLDQRMIRDFSEKMNGEIKNACQRLLPKKLIPIVLGQAGIGETVKVNQITKEIRLKLVDTVKDFKVPLKGLRDMDEAIITRGGICVDEIDPSSMESKLVSGLFFAGEILDLDALTGGFNLQIAWSTGYLAGRDE